MLVIFSQLFRNACINNSFLCWWNDWNGNDVKGNDCVIWYKPVETFPYIGGVGGIVMSWFLSPVFSGLIAMFVFSLTRCLVLRKEFNSNRINWAYPVLIGSTMTINTFFIIYKGAKGLGLDKTPIDIAFGVAFGIGGISALITIPIVPKLKSMFKINLEIIIKLQM